MIPILMSSAEQLVHDKYKNCSWGFIPENRLMSSTKNKNNSKE
jgi:hypothetical protein